MAKQNKLFWIVLFIIKTQKITLKLEFIQIGIKAAIKTKLTCLLTQHENEILKELSEQSNYFSYNS